MQYKSSPSPDFSDLARVQNTLRLEQGRCAATVSIALTMAARVACHYRIADNAGAWWVVGIAFILAFVLGLIAVVRGAIAFGSLAILVEAIGAWTGMVEMAQWAGRAIIH